jgi:NAD(P)-dependent dehydrogenase (short-subunit alcohol dehydrogenase family)
MTDLKVESKTTGNRLSGRHILITGAASGIGLATARRFAAEGACLALLDREEIPLRRVAEQLGAFAVVVDLVNEDEIRRAVAESATALKAIDGVVNVAGIGSAKHGLAAQELADWNLVLAVNLTAPFLICREALPHPKSAGGGTIVNISSGQGLMPSSMGTGAYCASKAGLVMLSKQLAMELAPAIRVNAVCPGVVATPLLPESYHQVATAPGSPYALKRVAAAQEIADAILYLTCHESSFVTGVALAVDGGRTYH